MSTPPHRHDYQLESSYRTRWNPSPPHHCSLLNSYQTLGLLQYSDSASTDENDRMVTTDFSSECLDGLTSSHTHSCTQSKPLSLWLNQRRVFRRSIQRCTAHSCYTASVARAASRGDCLVRNFTRSTQGRFVLKQQKYVDILEDEATSSSSIHI